MGQYGQITGMVNESKAELSNDGFGLMQVDEERNSPRMQTEGDEVITGAPMVDSGQGDAPIFKTDDRETAGGAMNLEEIGVNIHDGFESDGEESIFKLTSQNCAGGGTGSPLLITTQGPDS